MHFNFLKTYQGTYSKSYGPLMLILIYMIHPVIVHVYKTFSFLAFLVPEKSVMKIFKNSKIWKPTKEYNTKSSGPLATILPLHLPHVKNKVWY